MVVDLQQFEALALVLAVTAAAVSDRIAAVAFIGLLGVAAFATVAPLQRTVLEKMALVVVLKLHQTQVGLQ